MAIPEKYEFVASIGEGHFAKVASYRDTDANAKVAIKRLKASHRRVEDSVRRFRKEIELLEQLAEIDGVIQLLDVIADDDELAYVMPLGTGNLYSYIKANNNKINLADRVGVFDQILPTMRDSHNAGVLHRDISPQNVIVFESDENVIVNLCDFGLGKSTEALTAYTKTSVGGFGHAFYVAPEQFASLKRATIQSDVHALGKLLNFVMTGKDPDRHYNCEFSVVIQKATQADPTERYRSLADFEQVYETIKELHFGESAKSGALVLADLEVDDEVDWHSFHAAAISPNYDGHVYYGYIKPVIGYLLHDNHLEEYFETVEGDIASFVEQLIASIDECIGTVGWPFNATGSFGRVLERIMSAVDETEVQLMCVNELWDIAYGGDQWDVQQTIEGIFRSRRVPKEIQTSVAVHIGQAGISVNPDRFSGIALPKVIRNAIAQLAE